MAETEMAVDNVYTELSAAVRGIKEKDPLGEMLVVAPTPVARTNARRYLGRVNSGYLGITCETLSDLAANIAADQFPNGKLSQIQEEKLWKKALKKSAFFKPVAKHEATLKAALRTHRELREFTEAELSTLEGLTAVADAEADGRQLPKVTVEFLKAYRQVAEGIANSGCYDDRLLYDAAAQALADKPDFPPIVLWAFGSAELTPSQERFVAELKATGLAVSAGRELSEAELDEAFASVVTGDSVTASDSDDEVRHVVRSIASETANLDYRYAVLYPKADPYAEMLQSRFDRAGIKVSNPGVTGGKYGTGGIQILPISETPYLDVDVVYVVGLSDDLYPGRPPLDPFLPEWVRVAARQKCLPLATTATRAERLRRQLGAAFNTDFVRISMPRGDLRSGVARVPTRWLSQAFTELETEPGQQSDGALQLASHTSALLGVDYVKDDAAGQWMIADELEYRARQASQPGADPAVQGEIVQAARTMVQRRRAGFNEYSGNVSSVTGLPDPTDPKHPQILSPTRLQSLAECPFGYFVANVLRARYEDPESELEIASSADIGTLIHGAYEDLVTYYRVFDALPKAGEPWPNLKLGRYATAEEVIIAAFKARAKRFEAKGRTGLPKLWKREKKRIIATLKDMVVIDNEQRAAGELEIYRAEFGFGGGTATLTVSPDEAPQVTLPTGKVVRLRGSIDKLDIHRNVDGQIDRYVITDIKSGSSTRYELKANEPFNSGGTLQLPAYAAAIDDVLVKQGIDPDTIEKHTRFWFVHKESVEITRPETVKEFARALEVLLRPVSKGFFPPRKPKIEDRFVHYVQCQYCNPDGMGYAYAEKVWDSLPSNADSLVDLKTFLTTGKA